MKLAIALLILTSFAVGELVGYYGAANQHQDEETTAKKFAEMIKGQQS